MPSDIASDYAETQVRIANLPCSESSYLQALKELIRWNNPGTDVNRTVSRFVSKNNLSLPRPQFNNNPTVVLFRAVKNMMNATDSIALKKDHWNELDIHDGWRNYPQWRIFTQDQLQRKDRPLWATLQKCSVGPDRVTVGIPHFQHDAVYEAVNRLQSLTHRPATAEQVHLVIGKNALLRPLRQNGVPWRTLTTSDARMATLWTLAVAGSMWGVEFVDSFLEFCTAVLVGPICAVSREECKEAFAACVAVATIARARSIAHEELRHCRKVWWMVDVIEKASSSAHNTLLHSRYITKVTGKRVAATACNKWETPLHPNTPVNTFYVIGRECGHPQNANQDGSFGARCDGRFVLVTRIEDFGEERMKDGAMRVALTHNNPQASNNILACLEQRGIWAYVQGPRECLNCAYEKALRHGFSVVIDGPQAENATTCERAANFSARPFWTFALLLTFGACLGMNQVAAINVPRYGDHPPYFVPNSTCEHLTHGPTRSATSWSRLFGIIRALQSVILTVVAVRSGKRFVSRSVFGLITATVSTLLAGFSGWILTDSCAQYKAMAILKGFMTAAINRFAYEMIDVLCMFVSIIGLAFAIVFPITQANYWVWLEQVPLVLICLSAMYIWRWYDTGVRMAMSRGVVGGPVPLVASHIIALGLAVVGFIFTTKEDNKASAVSYVSDGLMMGEVLLQFVLLR